MSKKRIWLSYDLGLRGDYPGLYTLLDGWDAKEIGNSAATFMFDFDGDDESLVEELKVKIQNGVSINSNSRIYVIRAVEDDYGKMKVVGSFLFGSRKYNPWDGYACKGESEVDN